MVNAPNLALPPDLSHNVQFSGGTLTYHARRRRKMATPRLRARTMPFHRPLQLRVRRLRQNERVLQTVQNIGDSPARHAG